MKPSMISLACLLLLAPAAGVTQDKVELNTISKVQAIGGTIEITGSKKPSFTTFTMTDPPRLVIDISEAVFSGVPEEAQVGNGIVTAIKIASYGSDASAIARVLIGFSKDVETDIQSQGSSLLVKVLGAAGDELVATEDPSKPPDAATVRAKEAAAESARKAEADRKAQEQAAKEAAKRAEEERLVLDKAAKEAAKRAEEERLAQDKAAAEAAKRAQEERLADEKAAKEAARRAEEERLAKEKAAKEAALAEKQRKAEEARAAAEVEKQRKAAAAEAEKKRKAEEAQASVDTEKQRKAAAEAEKQRKAEEARAEAEAEKKRKAEEARAGAEERKRAQEARAEAEAEKKRKAAAEEAERKRKQQEALAAAAEAKRSKPEGTRVAMVDPPPPAESGGPVSVSSRRKTITFLGFKQEAASSRVFIRTNEPVRYSVSGRDNAVVLELENTRFGLPNNERSLDTSYFDTAVAMVSPEYSSAQVVRIQIKLKEAVPYQAHQEGNEVIIDFQRPPRR